MRVYFYILYVYIHKNTEELSPSHSLGVNTCHFMCTAGEQHECENAYKMWFKEKITHP